LGAPPAAVAAFELALAIGAVFTHSDITLPRAADRTLRLILATPAVHERHHGIETPDQHTNYSGTLTLWDRLFGTWRAPAPEGMGRLGVAGVDEGEAARIRAGFAEPYAER
jgi:sterol desaturase/sphingolipid hydroxylase (fatty acid hydroxylase superfamily)